MDFSTITQNFLNHYRLSVKRSTFSTYERVIEAHILPYFGKMDIEKLDLYEIDEFLNRKFYENGLSASSVCLISTVLRHIFSFASDMGLNVISYQRIKRPKKDLIDVKILSKEEEKRLSEYCVGSLTDQKLGVLLSLYIGLRLGEACALKWKDFDLDNGTVHISRTVQRIKCVDAVSGKAKTKVIFDAPKSNASARCIPLPDSLLDILKLMKKENEDYVLSGSAHCIEPRCYQNIYNKILKEAGIEKINYHSLRHSFATNCVDLGFNPKILSEVLGHSDVSITFNTYIHPNFKTMRTYMNKICLY